MAVSSTSKTKQAARPDTPKTAKSLAQKPARKKPAAKKPAIKASARKTSAVKPNAGKANTIKPSAAKKAPSKKALTKKTLTKASPEKSTPSKLTLDAKLTQVETRLKRANALTRKNVKTLETLVESLQAQSKKDHSKQTAKFAAHVKTVNEKLTGFMGESQTEIAKDLFEASKSTNLSDIEAALTRSDARLAKTEMAQSEAMVKMNRHLANLATVMEARLGQIDASQQELKTSFDDKTAELDAQIKTVEADTSNALNLLGGKIEDFAQVLDARQNDLDTVIGTKIEDITTRSQAEFEALQVRVHTRLDRIEQQAPNTALDDNNEAQAKQQMQSLKDRLHMLEQYIADMDMSRRQNALQMPLQSVQQAPHIQSQTMQPQALQPQNQAGAMQVQPPHIVADQSNVVPITDAFAPSGAGDNPYAPPEAKAEPEPVEPAKDSHVPVEFNPEAYARTHAPAPSPQGLQLNQHAAGLSSPLDGNLPVADLPIPDLPIPEMPMPGMPVPNMPAPVISAPELPITDLSAADLPAASSHVPDVPPMLPPKGASGEYAAPNLPQGLEAVTQNTESGPIDAALPYADPAYAESGEMRAERVGAPSEGAKLKLPKPDFSTIPRKGSYLKLLLIGGAIAVLGLFAGKMLLGGDKYAPVPSAQSASGQAEGNSFQTASNTNSAASPTLDSVLGTTTAAPIGQYAETSQTPLSTSGQATLEDAANSGNPIAKYQLGLSHMQQNKTGSGVKLLRAAAAQNLPAAQYALAKIYETGQGVTPDLGQALQLTQRAAQSGHRIAMHDLALYYTDELNGVPVNVAKAESWFEKAAQYGVVDSQYNLAVLAELKEGERKDLDTAYYWYNIAAKQGDQFAKQRIDVVAGGMSPERIAAADARIEAFKPRQINAEVNGIFKNVPWEQPVQNVKIEQIRQAQTYLADLGYDVGTPDGAMGPRTRAAITEFEKAQALPETGAVNEALINKLELEVGA